MEINIDTQSDRDGEDASVRGRDWREVVVTSPASKRECVGAVIQMCSDGGVLDTGKTSHDGASWTGSRFVVQKKRLVLFVKLVQFLAWVIRLHERFSTISSRMVVAGVV